MKPAVQERASRPTVAESAAGRQERPRHGSRYALPTLRARREELGLSLEVVAQACLQLESIAPSTQTLTSLLSAIELGESRCSPELQILLAGALNMAPESLFAFDPSEARGAAFRARRLEAGLQQHEVVARAGVSKGYVCELEAGRLRNPTPEARVSLAAALGPDPPDVVFCDWPPPTSAWMAARRKLEIAYYEQDHSLAEVAERFDMASDTLVVADFEACGYAARPNRRTFRVPGKVTSDEAARKRGLDPRTLRKAIDADSVRGERFEQRGLGREGYVYLVVEAELDEDLAELPSCSFEECDRPALGPSGGCGRHAYAFAALGKPKPEAVRFKISRAKTGVPRPDQSERQRGFWQTGHGSVRQLLARSHVSGRTRQKWGGIWGGPLGGRPPLDKAKVRNAGAKALELYRMNPNLPPCDVTKTVALRLAPSKMRKPDGTIRRARDPVRRKAEKHVVRLLQAAAKLDDFSTTVLARDFG